MLSSKKVNEPEKKGKGYKDAQWEAEVRRSIANKKGQTSTTLSKQDLVMVRAQLEKESLIRQRVSVVKSKLDRGLNLVHSLVSAQVEEFHSCLSSIVDLFLRGAFGKGITLSGHAVFERYLVRNLSFGTERTI